MTFAQHAITAQGGGYGGPPGAPPPGGYGPPGGGGPPGGYGPPGGGGYGPPGGGPPGGYGPPGGGPPGGGPPGGPPGGGPPGGYPPGGGYGGPGGFGGPPPGPPPPGYGNPPPGYAGYPGPGGGPIAGPTGPAADIKKQATTWLIVSAASFFFCGFANCFGFIGGVLCFLAMQAADQNNVADAEAKLKWGKIVTIAGGVLVLVSGIIWVALYALGVFASVAAGV